MSVWTVCQWLTFRINKWVNENRGWRVAYTLLATLFKWLSLSPKHNTSSKYQQMPQPFKHMERDSAGQQWTDSWHPWGEVISVTLLDGLTGPDLCNQPHRMSKPMLYRHIRGNSTLMGQNISSTALSLIPVSHAYITKHIDFHKLKLKHLTLKKKYGICHKQRSVHNYKQRETIKRRMQRANHRGSKSPSISRGKTSGCKANASQQAVCQFR